MRHNIAYNTGEIPNNGIDDDENGYIDDYNGYNFDATEEENNWSDTDVDDSHGTKAAGIAAADFDNNLGVVGTGGNCNIFPLRAGSDKFGRDKVIYGFESIIYSAVRGFDVVNCSWGNPKSFSSIEQSIIDYAVANDVVVVAAAGNETVLEKYFPAGYDGVIGVGAVTAFDSDAGGPKGSHLKIYAPSSQNYTTVNYSGNGSPYGFVTPSTSFSTPVVAGAAAILRSYRPELSALEVIEHLRQSVDDISENKTFYKKITAGRLNMLKMLNVDPMSIPGMRIRAVRLFNSSGVQQEKFNVGDTVSVELELKNVLGNAGNLSFNLSLGHPEFPAIELIDSEFNDITFARNQVRNIGKFKFVITNNYDDYFIMRLDITNQSGYSDFILFDFKPENEMATFENEKIKFSISDVGTFGFESGKFEKNYKEGVGFIDKEHGNGLFRSGVFVVENDANVITSLFFTNERSEFVTLKPYSNPKNTGSILSDDPFQDTKVEITQTIELPKALPWVRIKIDLTDSAAFGSQYSVGYEFDWDVGYDIKYRDNQTQFLPNARPESIDEMRFAAISTSNYESGISYGAAMYSDEIDALAQAAGYSREDGAISINILKTSMQSGKTIITDDIFDVYNLLGIRFTDNFDDYETKTCYLCVSSADNNEILASNLQECASGVSSVEFDKYNKSIEFIDNRFEINNASYIKTEVYNLSGMLINSISDNTINLNQLNQGVYLVRIEFEDGFIIKKVAITR